MEKHPITPPPEMMSQWLEDAPNSVYEIIAYVAKRAAVWGYEQHEKELLDAMHSVVPQPYEPEVDEHGYPLKLGDFYAS